MAGATRYYSLAFFDFGDQLDAPLNVQKEIDRFVIIDKQIYGLYSIFGNGVINGWTVSDNGFSQQNGISVKISPGTGIIRAIAAETTFPGTVSGLPPLSNFDIYAVLQGSTVRDRAVDFTYSQTALGDFAVKLASVTTGNNSVTSINNNVKELIGFKQLIKDEIDAHKHRGSPSKIDLKKETKGQLPGAKIEGIDASKITSGVLPLNQLPIVSHEDLEYDGLLTHAQLDSFVKTLSETNKELLGEISSVNLLKHILFMKYKYSDIDEHFVNELAVIPGITPNSYIDFEASTAVINLDQMCISGVPPKTGEFVDILFNTRTSFENAFKKTNLTVRHNGSVILERDESAKDVIEDFENASSAGSNIPGFTLSSEVVIDNFSIKAEATDTLKVDGFYSGKFNTNRTFRALFTKEFSSVKDWSNFDELVVSIKTISSSHGSVFAYFVNEFNSIEQISPNLLLLASDEITDNPDISRNDFETRTFNISNYNRDNVTKFVIFTDDTSSSFEFFVDDIYVQNTALFKPQGTIKLRYSSGAPVTFHSIFYDIDEPSSTFSLIRVKVASSSDLLSRASYTLGMSDGQVFALTGTHIEIEATLGTEDQEFTPELSSIGIRLFVDSETHGFNIDETSDWSLGTTRNIDIIPTSGSKARLQLTDPINVGGLYFSTRDSVTELDDFNVGVIGFSGVRMPISVAQAYNWFDNPIRGFDNPSSVIRTIEKNFIIADTNNDRVLLVDEEGNLVKGFAGIPTASASFFPVVSVYNPDNQVLTIICSRDVDHSSISLSKISIFINATEMKLGDDEVIRDISKSQQIIEIEISDDKAEQLIGQTNNLYVNFADGAFVEPISNSDQAGSLLGTRGIEIFVGDLTYIDNLLKPIYVNILTNDNWVICNGETKISPVSSDSSSAATTTVNSVVQSALGASSSATTTVNIPSLIEINPKEPDSPELTYDDISFSIYSLGGVVEMPLNRLAIAGIVNLDSDNNSSTSTTSTTSTTKNIYKVEYDNIVTSSGNSALTSAASITLESEDGSYGVREVGTGTVVVEAKVQMIQTSKGKYLYTFEAAAGKEFEAVVKVKKTSTSEFEFIAKNIKDSSITDNFTADAIESLSDYRGAVVIVNRDTGQKLFKYISPDGLYASDVDIAPDGNLLVAETDFEGNSGRIIKLDSFGNIIFQYGQGRLGVIKDAKALDNGNFILSL